MSKLLDWGRQQLDNALSPTTPAYQQTFIRNYDFKTRFAMLGTVAAGKSTVAGCMLVTAHTKSNDDPTFYCQTVELKSGIRISASNLRRGIFPPKTKPTGNTTYESGIKIRRTSMWGDKFVHIPIVDVAGEDLQYLLGDFDMNNIPNTVNYKRLSALLTYIKESQGFIIVLPAPRVFTSSGQMENEPDDLAEDPDVNLSRLLEKIVQYKEQHRGNPIKGIAVVITKYDLFQDYAIKHNMNLYSPGGIDQFMRIHFPDTNMQLKYLKEKGLVRFFPSHVGLEYNENGVVERWNAPGKHYDKKPKVKRVADRNIPEYSERAYMALFDYLEQFAS
jgi:hypothetical protein